MNSQVPDALISAFFDGEVSPEERAVVERLLTSNENEEAQRELNETARLSALLHSFPRESAPVELVANVLRQTNQMSLAPLTSTPAMVNPARNVWRDWKAAFIGAAITASAMCLMVALTADPLSKPAASPMGPQAGLTSSPELPRPAMPSEPMVAMDDRAGKSQEDVERLAANSETDLSKEAVAPAKQTFGVQMPMAASRERVLMERKASVAASVPEGNSDPVNNKAPAITTVQQSPSDSLTLGLNESGLTNDEFLKGLSEGKVYVLAPQPADPNNNVAVVYLEVVDIDRSAEKMQVLLKKNSIEPRSVNKDGEATPNDLVVLYVIAPGEKLANTVKDVERHPDLFPKWTTQAPLQLAAVGDETAPEPQKKDLASRAVSADKEKQTERLKTESERDAEMPEVQIVLDAYAQRNGIVNSSMSNAIANSGGQFGGNRDGRENPKRQSVANAGREKSKGDLNQQGGSQVQPGQRARTESGYDFVRLNNSIAANNGAVLSQSNTPQINPLRTEQSRRPFAYSNAEKPAGGEANNRALRMLFVLHPQSEPQPPTAAAPAKAK